MASRRAKGAPKDSHKRQNSGLHTVVSSASGAPTIASQSEINLVQTLEKIKSDIRASVKTLALLAHSHSGPFAHHMAFESVWLETMLNATDPSWRTNPQWATALTAFEYFASFRTSAEELGEALQTAAPPR